MADNVVLNAGTGGATMATDQAVGGEHHQYVKVEFGADNTQTPVTSSAGLPVTPDSSGFTVTANLGATDNAVLDAIAASVAGTLTVGSHAVTNAGTFAVQVDAALPAGTNAIGKLAANSGVDIGDVDVTSLDGVAAEAAALGNGILIQGDDGTDRKNINVDATTGDVQVDVTNTVTVDATASGDVPVTLAGEAVVLGAGSAAIGKLAANSGVDIGDVDVTSIAAGANLIGDVGLSGARTSGGTTPYYNLDVDETEDAIKASAGQLFWLHAMNLTASKLYLKFYDATVATVVVGTTTPVLSFAIPTQGDTNGAGFTLAIPNGIAFATAITVACTTGFADNDTGAPGANSLILNAGYA